MQAEVRFRDVRLIKVGSHPVVVQSERVDVTRISADHELQLESPIETDLRVERALRRNYGLVHHELVAPVIKKPAEVLIIFRTIGVSSKAAFNPTVNGQARLRLFLFDELSLCVFLGRSK